MSVKLVADRITPNLDKKIKALDSLMPKVYNYFKSRTPIRTGQARQRTRLQGHTIHANYPYAQRLDEGYSRQSPDGMTKPTAEFLEQQLKRIMEK